MPLRDPLLWLIGVYLLVLALLSPASAFASGFGIEPGSFRTTLSATGAGEHADLTAAFTLNQEPAGDPQGYLRDIRRLKLPPGLVADPGATPLCTMGAVEKELCPSDTAVGVAELTTAQPSNNFESVGSSSVLIYNIAPYSNEPAAYSFDTGNLPIRLDTAVELEGSGSPSSNYDLTMSATDLSDVTPVISATVTLWGVPAEHNGPGALETTQCHINEVLEVEECVKYGGPGEGPRRPFISDPVKCGSLPAVGLSLDSWQGEAAESQEASLGPIVQCEGLQFEPSISTIPAHTQAREPTGYEVAVRLPGNQDPEGRAAADLQRASIRLPLGTVISPSATNGLQACSDGEFSLDQSRAAACPPASEIGSTTITTPLLAKPMEGQLFLGTPECEPCSAQDAQEGKMLRVLVQAAGSGVIVKLAGSISVDQSTGRLTLSLDESPQLPLEELELSLNGGEGALLANPAECSATVKGSAQLTPYSSPTATEVSAPGFQPTGCGSPQFAPTFSAGTVSNQAGSASAALVTIARGDQDQSLERFTVRMPPGLLGLLSKVPACPASVAQLGACSSQSQIGSVTVAAGPGGKPLNLTGALFLTGPYEGAPFGLSIAVPAQAGPIDLGAINIRAGIDINPTTAALSIVSGPIPQSLAGIPLQIKALDLDIDREGFMVNPTDCRPWTIDASLGGAQGASANATEHFQAASCAKLPFKPKLTALTNAKTTRLGGAYVHIKLASQTGQANVGKVKLDFPKALPSRLTTLQGSCREAAFKADPASCPASSDLGTGVLTTPFMRSPLTGPLYLVSHGSRALPDLDAVMQAEGVTLILTGTTGFSGGISSDAFRSLPDAPISTLDLMFPAGPSSAFAANKNLCNRVLAMPAVLTGQNGAVIKQTDTIAVSGCPRAKPRRAGHRG